MTAQRHVEELAAAADPENRDSGLQRRLSEGKLVPVPVRLDPHLPPGHPLSGQLGFQLHWIRISAEINVPAAREEQAIQRASEELLAPPPARIQTHRLPAAPKDGRGV